MDKNDLIPNKTADYYRRLSYLTFLFGMPNFWIEDLRIPKLIFKIYYYLSKFITLTFFVFIVLELTAFVTQKGLNSKQVNDRLMYSMAHPFLLVYVETIARKEDEIKKWLTHVLELKMEYNDPSIEDQMVRKSAFTSTVLVLTCIASMFTLSLSALVQVVKFEGTFTTIITAWPLVDDVSSAAAAVRIITNIVWWLLIIRLSGTYILVVSLITCTSFQFVNLQSYFRGLEGIFREDLTQSQMEQKYENGLKTGIRLHSETFVCFNRVKQICGVVLSGQMVSTITMLVFFMSQMLRSERTIVNAVATAISASAVLLSSGLFMWNAGDITIEASNIATAMYWSGWQNCRGNSNRIRRLLVTAMTYAQEPVVVKGFGMLELSYQSFVSLVKTSYSVFSVIF